MHVSCGTQWTTTLWCVFLCIATGTCRLQQDARHLVLHDTRILRLLQSLWNSNEPRRNPSPLSKMSPAHNPISKVTIPPPTPRQSLTTLSICAIASQPAIHAQMHAQAQAALDDILRRKNSFVITTLPRPIPAPRMRWFQHHPLLLLYTHHRPDCLPLARLPACSPRSLELL